MSYLISGVIAGRISDRDKAARLAAGVVGMYCEPTVDVRAGGQSVRVECSRSQPLSDMLHIGMPGEAARRSLVKRDRIVAPDYEYGGVVLEGDAARPQLWERALRIAEAKLRQPE